VRPDPELAFHNGTVFDGARFMPAGTVVRVSNGKITAVEPDAGPGAAGKLGDAEPVDLHGGTLLPGFIDAHVHPVFAGDRMCRCNLAAFKTAAEYADVIADYAASHPDAGWITGGGWSMEAFPGGIPTKGQLDQVTGGRPAFLPNRDGHGAWVNSRALEIAGIDASTPDPPDGRIERDPSGAPTGILKENANRLADAVVPLPTSDECFAAIERGQREAHRRGITAIEDLEGAAAFSAFQRRRDRGDLRLRVAMGIPHASLDSAIALGLRSGLGDEWLRVGHLKIFTDGALGSQTAALEEPYVGTSDRGLLTIDPATLGPDVIRAAEGGIAVAIHAIGDRAVRVALDAIAPTRATHPALRQRVEHLQLLRRQDIARFGALGVIASMQPIHATSDRDLVDRYWGPERATRAYPWRQLLSAGAHLAFGSDAPVEPIDPLLGVHAAVARQRPADADRWHPEEALTLPEAIAGYTSGAAYAMNAERERGTLAVGMRCDATVVERDLLSTPVAEWPALKVSATIVGGEIVHALGIR